MQQELERRVREKFESGPHVSVHDFQIMEDGHAGLTYGFTVSTSGQTDRPNETRQYVLKVAPVGIRRSGNTDVFRQAQLLRTLFRVGLPVPDVPFASDGEEELGTPYIIMERLPGRTFVIWEPHASFGPDETDPIWVQTTEALASIHAYDSRTGLADWNHRAELDGQVAFWSGILNKAEDEDWKRRGAQLAAALDGCDVTPGPIGLMHGDYQPGNVLFDGGRLTGIIDWELACIGPQNLDVGWLLMMADKQCWHPDWSPRINLSREDVLTIYQAARGRAVEDVDWFQALACFRMTAIACLNIKLHRNGRRHDPIWEKFATCVTPLLDRGFSLLNGLEEKVA